MHISYCLIFLFNLVKSAAKLDNRTEVYVKEVEDLESIEDLIIPKSETVL